MERVPKSFPIARIPASTFLPSFFNRSSRSRKKKERNDDEYRRAENISAASASSRASCVDGRARRTRTRTTTRTSTNRRPPTEIFSSFYSRLRPFTSPDRFSRGLNTGMHRQRPGICVRTSHVYSHIHTHTRICAPRTYPVAEKRITIFFSGN